jgi:hypothetical protein
MIYLLSFMASIAKTSNDRNTMPNIEFHPWSEDSELLVNKPTPTKQNVPDWYRKQPSYVNKDEFLKKGVSGSTIKKCMPIFDAMTAGYTIYCPVDIYVDATDPSKLEYNIPIAIAGLKKEIFTTHSPEQVTHYPMSSNVHKDVLRINPMWSVKTSPGYSSLFTVPMHQPVVPFTLVPGIIDTDSYMSEGFLSFKIDNTFKGIIEKGTPIAQVIPFKRESWTSEIIDYADSKENQKQQRMLIRSKFFNYYKNNFWHKKEWH